MHVPARLGEQGWDVAGGTLGAAVEDCLSTVRRGVVITVRRSGRGCKRQLVEMQVRKFWVIKSTSLRTLSKPFCAAIGKRVPSANRGSKEVPLPCISRFATKAFQWVTEPRTCPGMQVDSCQAKRRRNQCRGRFVTVEGLSVHKEFSIEFSRPPTREYRADRGFIHIQQLGDAAEVRGKIDNRTYIQITVCPAILTMTDSGSQRIVDGGMADSALDAHRF